MILARSDPLGSPHALVEIVERTGSLTWRRILLVFLRVDCHDRSLSGPGSTKPQSFSESLSGRPSFKMHSATVM